MGLVVSKFTFSAPLCVQCTDTTYSIEDFSLAIF